jgi:hypothetical protein
MELLYKVYDHTLSVSNDLTEIKSRSGRSPAPICVKSSSHEVTNNTSSAASDRRKINKSFLIPEINLKEE